MKKPKKIWHLFLIPVVMFGFGYLMVPIYNVFCEITGLNGKTGQISSVSAERLRVDEDRMVKVEFDGSLNQDAAWSFEPSVRSMWVSPGKTYSTYYVATNTKNDYTVGQATPSLSPARAATYFNKTECFCFTQQEFQPYEKRQLPLIFVVDPQLPEDVHTVTLSYTFFDITNKAINKS